MEIVNNPQLSGLCSIRIGGVGSVLYMPQTIEEICELAPAVLADGAVLCGWGSNLVFGQKLERPVIKLHPQGFGGIALVCEKGDGAVLLDVGGGCGLTGVLGFCRDKGLSGLEALAGIPASTGGAVVMNAGAHGFSVGDAVESVWLFSLEEKREYWLSADEMDFSYRHSLLQDSTLIALGVRFRLRQDNSSAVADRMSNYLFRRITAKIKYPNCGSVFKNPENSEPAGKLLDLCGLRGKVCGGLQVSNLHANIFENHGEATCGDFLDMCCEAQSLVMERMGIELHPEARIIRD